MSTPTIAADLDIPLRLDIEVGAPPVQQPVEECTFTLKLVPSPRQMKLPEYKLTVPVLLVDQWANMTRVNVTLSSKGDFVTQIVKVPISDASRPRLGPPENASRNVVVIVDPGNAISESKEQNNATWTCCYSGSLPPPNV